jgi:hypothetical protein
MKGFVYSPELFGYLFTWFNSGDSQKDFIRTLGISTHSLVITFYLQLGCFSTRT